MLTVSAVTQVGPLMLETAIKHYLKRKTVTKDSKAREELLFDEAFVLVKAFLEISTRHTVDELQKFSLTRTPSPPWVLLHRVLIPINPTCSRAADVLIEALGGPEQALKMCGGTKWWTVRMQAGVEAEWIGIKKDWHREEQRRQRAEEERRKKREQMSAFEKSKDHVKERMHGDEESEVPPAQEEGDFAPEMDHLRCMLYIHGGAYYWGSINTHRYTIWRYARKMRGRCFAVNYRKAPQFPWPCALQDCIAAYLYLLEPPEGARHRPIDPRKIIIAGDSAGGGLTLALLQVIRDAGLPMPAGAVLISPWGDLTHSFPSILSNTATDIIPPYGFIHKPSTLWPPPPPEMTAEVQGSLRHKVKEAVHRLASLSHKDKETTKDAATAQQQQLTQYPDTATAPPPPVTRPRSSTTARGDTKLDPKADSDDKEHSQTMYPVEQKDPHHHPGPTQDKEHPSVSDPAGQKHFLTLDVDGQQIEIRSQIQLYCTNDQLSHPYVSPALGYLGGLPPLLIIASDKEVLRDEIIYCAHKAANPEAYPIREEVKDLLPSLRDIDGKYPPTRVHLQVYDGTCHVLPLFSMCEPAKHCYRAIANFCRFVTQESVNVPQKEHSMPPPDVEPIIADSVPRPRAAKSMPAPLTMLSAEPSNITNDSVTSSPSATLPPTSLPTAETTPEPSLSDSRRPTPSSRGSFRKRVSLWSKSNKSETASPTNTAEATDDEAFGTDIEESIDSSRLNSQFPSDEIKMPKNIPPGYAGNAQVYAGHAFAEGNMIRERVSLHGECRALEPASELQALNMPLRETGVIKEGPALRYLNGQKLWDEKFKHEARRIEKRRQEHLRKATSDQAKAVETWTSLIRDKKERSQTTDKPFDEASFIFDNEFSWTWALKGEVPPPTAIVGRRDTNESRRLARMADRMTDDTVHIGGLSLWTAMNAFFSKESGSSNSSSKESTSIKIRQ